jgi:hypothetical protein
MRSAHRTKAGGSVGENPTRKPSELLVGASAAR